jgi:hypothetical protein
MKEYSSAPVSILWTAVKGQTERAKDGTERFKNVWESTWVKAPVLERATTVHDTVSQASEAAILATSNERKLRSLFCLQLLSEPVLVSHAQASMSLTGPAADELLNAFRAHYRRYENAVHEAVVNSTDAVVLWRLGDDLDQYLGLVNEVSTALGISTKLTR